MAKYTYSIKDFLAIATVIRHFTQITPFFTTDKMFVNLTAVSWMKLNTTSF